jgi:hypothetical protein
MTFEFGLARFTPLYLSIASNIMFDEKANLSPTFRLNKLAAALMNNEYYNSMRGRAMMQIYTMRHWREPLSLLPEAAYESYRLSMKAGDLEGAFQVSLLFSGWSGSKP